MSIFDFKVSTSSSMAPIIPNGLASFASELEHPKIAVNEMIITVNKVNKDFFMM